MKAVILRSVLKPLFERVGTMIAAYMIARGVDSDAAAQVVNGLVAFAAIVLDLLTSAINRQREMGALISQHLNQWPTTREDD